MVSRQQFVNTLHFVHGKIGKCNCFPFFPFFNHTIHKFLKISYHINTNFIRSDLLRERIQDTRLKIDRKIQCLYFLHLQLSSTLSPFHWNTLDHITIEKSMQTSCMKQLPPYQKVRQFNLHYIFWTFVQSRYVFSNLSQEFVATNVC